MSKAPNAFAAPVMQAPCIMRGSEEEEEKEEGSGAGDRHPCLDYNNHPNNPDSSPDPNHHHHDCHRRRSPIRNFTEASYDCAVTAVGLVTKAEDSSGNSGPNKQTVVTTTTAAVGATTATQKPTAAQQLSGAASSSSGPELGFTLPPVSSAATSGSRPPGAARVRFDDASASAVVFTDAGDARGGKGNGATAIRFAGNGGNGRKEGRNRRKLIRLGEAETSTAGLGRDERRQRCSAGLRGEASKRERFEPRNEFSSAGLSLSPSRAESDAAEMDTIYRCVPARPTSYTFSDVLSSMTGAPSSQLKNSRSKTAPVSTNAPEEYAERFKSRPTTRPAVVEFNGTGVKMFNTSCGGGFRHLNHPGFPPVRVKSFPLSSGGGTAGVKLSKSPTLPQPLTERVTTSTSNLHLAPLTKGAEPDTALSLQTRSYRPSPSLHTHRTLSSSGHQTKAPSIAEPSRFHGVRSAASTRTNKSRGKSSSSSHLGGKAVNGGGGGATSGGANHHYRLPSSTYYDARLTMNLDDGDQTGGGGPWPELTSSKLNTVDAVTFSISPRGLGEHLAGSGSLPRVLAHSDDYDNLSDLPRPKRILPRRDLPWVFRFKVKKEMNALSKIMASKPNSASNSVATTAGP